MAEEKKKNYLIEWGIFIVCLLGLFFFLKENRQGKLQHYYAYFNDIKGLQPSSPVQINGVRVGKISDITLNGNNRVKITLAVNKDVALPEGTVAALASGGFTGEKVIYLEPGKGENILPDNATLITHFDTSVLPISVRIKPMLETAKLVLNSADVGLRGFNYIINTGMVSTTASALVAIDQQTSKLSGITTRMLADSNQIPASIDKAYRKTSEMAANSSETTESIRNMQERSAAAAHAPLSDNIRKLQANISQLGKAFSKLHIDTGAGKWINDKAAYQNTTLSLDTANRDMRELYENPQGISIFGGKKK